MIIIESLPLLLCLNLCAMVRGEEPKEVKDPAAKIAELKKLRETLPSLHLKATSVTRSGAETRESKTEIWETNKNGVHKYRRVISATPQPGTSKEEAPVTSLLVKDGENAHRQMDLGTRALVFRGKSKQVTEYLDIEKVAETGVPRLREGEKVLDEACVLLEIREKANQEDIKASYWISEKTGLVLKSIVESADATLTEMKVSEYKTNDDIPDSLFRYKPPGNAQVFDEQQASPGKGE